MCNPRHIRASTFYEASQLMVDTLKICANLKNNQHEKAAGYEIDRLAGFMDQTPAPRSGPAGFVYARVDLSLNEN